MAKPEIPYERVSEAAFGLHAREEKITNRSVRAISGGSPTTVSKHLKRLEAEHPQLFTAQRAAGGPELPAGVLRVLSDELRRQVAEVSAALEGQLATAKETIDDLTRENAELQDESSQLEGRRDELAAENERLQGQVQQQATDLQRLQEQLAAAQADAHAVRVQLAKAELKAEDQQKLADTLANERDSLRGALEKEREGRLAAEKSLATATAALEQLRQRVEQQQKHVDQITGWHDALETERNDLQNKLATERTEHATLAGKLATSEAQTKAAVARADDLQQREKDLQSQLKELRAELRQMRTMPTEQPTPPAAGGGK